MIRAIVLAAGFSTRMGVPKALLDDGQERTFVARVVRTLAAADVRDVTVVTGTVHEALVRAVALDPPSQAVVRFARNPDPSRGQLSSLLAGLEAADAPGVEAVLVTLVDVAFVAPPTVRAVVEAFERTRAPIVRPANGARHGHPVLFAHPLFGELRRADPGEGAKPIVRAHAAGVVNVEVEDEGAFADIDTPAEYRRALEQLRV